MLYIKIKNKVFNIKLYPFIILIVFLLLLFIPFNDRLNYQECYNALNDVVKNNDTEITINKPLTDTIEKKAVYKIINGTHTYFHLKNVYHYNESFQTKTFQFDYNSYNDNYEQHLQRYNELLEEIVKDIKDYSDYDKLKYLHDYIIDNFEYDNTYSSYSSLSMLDNKKGICSSYTLLFSGLLEKLNIENIVVFGKTEAGYGPSYNLGLHVWNLVKLDGNWYHIDTTWDDNNTNRYQYFLVSDDFMKDNYHYKFFCLDEENYKAKDNYLK